MNDKLLSEEMSARLLSFSRPKKLTFLLLLYERMIPELRSFCRAQSRDFSIFQRDREEFWRFLADGHSSRSWPQLTEDILGATPDSDEFGTLEGSFALNAGLVAAEIAGFIADGQNSHIVDAASYAFDSLDFKIGSEPDIVFDDPTAMEYVDDYVMAHPFAKRERQTEEEDVSLLATLPDAAWPAHTVAMLRHRAESRQGLLSAVTT